ncbi:hypothetical protein B0I35DRAFT_337604, partial [Stachybotrys elegans]
LLPQPTEINNEHRAWDVTAWCAVMCGLATIVVLLRLYVSIREHNFMLDDWAAAFSSLCYVAWSGLAIWANVHTGVGKPMWEITVAEYELWFRTIVACSFLYPVMSTAIRATILLFYRRLFSRNKEFNMAINVLLGIQAVYFIIFTILPGFVCTPISASWNLELYATHCNLEYYYDTTVAVYGTSLALDIILTVIPVWPISQLKMPLRKRMGVVSLFLMGFIATAATAVKLGFWVYEFTAPWSDDPIWLSYQFSLFLPNGLNNYRLTFWIPSQIESTLALICASVPAL